MRKTILLLVLSLSGVARAQAAVSHRCDVSWLKKAHQAVLQGQWPDDPKHYLSEKPVRGGDDMILDTEGGIIELMPKVCGAMVWKYLFESDAGIRLGWPADLEPQIKLLLSVDALYYDAETQGSGVDPTSSAELTEIMRASVQSQLELLPDYADLSDLYDEKSADKAWAAGPEGLAVAAQLNGLRKDAASVTVEDNFSGRTCSYTLAGQLYRDPGIAISELTSYTHRRSISMAIAKNILSLPFNDGARAALSDYRSRHGSEPAQ